MCALPRCIVEQRLHGVTEKTTGCVMLSANENDFNEEDDADEANVTGQQPLQQIEGKTRRKLQT